MAKRKKINFLWSAAGDWVGIYMDGEKIHEGHNVTVWQFVKLLKEQGITLPFSLEEGYATGEAAEEIEASGLCPVRFPENDWE